jgi:hypothetical protein
MLTLFYPLRYIVTKRKTQTQKKNLRAKPLFYKSPAPRKTKNKVSPFFTGFLQHKSQSTIFGGSDLEIKPLEYINRRFYKFQFIIRTKLKL